jgi:hypothetical protein
MTPASLNPLSSCRFKHAGGVQTPPSLPALGQPDSPSTTFAWNHFEPLVFYALILLILIPLWSVRYFPSQDGPLHLYNAIVLRDYNRPDRPLFRQFFVPNTRIIPNWVCPHLLIVLVRWLPPHIAEKMILSLYVLVFPLSVRYCLRGIRRHAGGLAIAALPFVPNQFYHMGFQDFCMSLAGFFISLGFYLRRRKSFGLLDAGVLAILFLATYLTHLLSAVMLLPMIGLIALFQAFADGHTLFQRLRRLLPVALAMLPMILAILYFLLEPHPTDSPYGYPKGWTHRFYFLIAWMRGLGWLDLVPDTAVFLLFAGVSLRLLRKLRRRRSWPAILSGLSGALLLCACAYFCVFLFASDNAAGGRVILVRLPAYPTFALLLWWAAIPLSSADFRKLERVVAGVSVPCLLVMLTLDMVNYVEIDRYLDQFAAIAPLLQPNSTLLPVQFENPRTVESDDRHEEVAVGIDPFLHAGSLGLGERGVVDLSDSWASTDHHVIRWRNGLSPIHNLQLITNFDAYSRETGKPIDYILIWTGGVSHDDLDGRSIRAQLKEYQRIYRSPNDYLELYRRTAALPAPSDPAVTLSR